MTDPSPATSTHPADRFSVAGRSALITGANGTLGQTAALALAAAGAKLTLVGEGQNALDQVAEQAAALGATAQTIDLRPDSEAKADQIAAAAVEAYGSVDIVVVGSGTNRVNMIGDAATEDWDAVIEANTTGPWLICRAAGRHMIANADAARAAGRAPGKIVLVSSTRGRHGHAGGYTAYCASKAAVDGLVRALACEWGPYGITVNALGPTVFRSNISAWMFAEDGPGPAVREGMLQRIPLGRLGEPDDLVGALMFLTSPASDFCTGQTLYVDGGYTAT